MSDDAKAQWLAVWKLDLPLPLPVYSAELLTRRPGRFVTFVGDEACTLLGTDLGASIGVSLSVDESIAFAITQYNAAVSRRNGVEYDASPIVILQALLRLISNDVSVRILNGVDDIPAKTKIRIPRTEKRMLKTLREQVRPAHIERGAEGITVVRFFTWEDLGGEVSQNTALLFADGRVSLSRTTMAANIGAYKRAIARL